MFERMDWKSAYELWQLNENYFGKALSSPLQAETVHVDYIGDGYFYGYDWLENTEAEKRKRLIQEEPTEFVCFTKASNRGTIQTATMLVEAQSKEEVAAIWIAATAKELCDRRTGKGVWHNAMMIQMAAEEFLRPRYWLWHHAMKRLVPEILIPQSVLDAVSCEEPEPVMGLIQMNVQMLKSGWQILRYSSLPENERPDVGYRRRA